MYAGVPINPTAGGFSPQTEGWTVETPHRMRALPSTYPFVPGAAVFYLIVP